MTACKKALKDRKPARKSIATFFHKSPHQQLPTPTSSPVSAIPSPNSQLAPHTGTAPRKTKSPPKPQMRQLHLANLGAATRTTIHCSTCQMQYNKIDPNDQKLHLLHHTSILRGPLFPKTSSRNIPWPITMLSMILDTGTFVIISSSSAKINQTRGLKILKTVDVALGAPQNLDRSTFFPRGGKIFCLLSEGEGRVISLVAAERIEHAYRRIPHGGDGVETTRQKEKAVMGISRMWTCLAERGKGYCKGLLEESLAGVVCGVKVSREQVAFSTPSESGMEVARRWCGREEP